MGGDCKLSDSLLTDMKLCIIMLSFSQLSSQCSHQSSLTHALDMMLLDVEVSGMDFNFSNIGEILFLCKIKMKMSTW